MQKVRKELEASNEVLPPVAKPPTAFVAFEKYQCTIRYVVHEDIRYNSKGSSRRHTHDSNGCSKENDY